MKHIIATAKHVEPSAPLNLVDSDTYWFDLSEASEFNAGDYAHPCDEEPLRVNPKRLADDFVERAIEDMCEEAFEDADSHVRGGAELRAAFEAALEAFNAAQTSSSWVPRTGEVFVIPASGTSGSAQDRNGLDPKGAGPTAEGGDAQKAGQ